MDNVRSLLVQILICFITFGVYKILLGEMVESNECCCCCFWHPPYIYPYVGNDSDKNNNPQDQGEVQELRLNLVEKYTTHVDSLDSDALDKFLDEELKTRIGNGSHRMTNQVLLETKNGDSLEEEIKKYRMGIHKLQTQM